MGTIDRIFKPKESTKLFGRLETLLKETYGTEKGEENFIWLKGKIESFLDSLSDSRLESQVNFDQSHPYDDLAQKVFAICYPDNIYNDVDPTLRTLGEVLKEKFPALGGIHILPERPMSHGDVWAQDLLSLVSPSRAASLITELQTKGFLDENKGVTSLMEEDPQVIEDLEIDGLMEIIQSAYNSHFNDGGFSQKSRDRVDPRFGEASHIASLSENYKVMLDYVVNHLDSDSDALEAFRKGEEQGEAFVIITPSEYERLKKEGTLAKTFRPRPFPLFTGMRKHPSHGGGLGDSALLMNRALTDGGAKLVDSPLLLMLSLWYKLVNDQGLTAEDKRVFLRFSLWAEENNLPLDFLEDSTLQSQQKKIVGEASKSLEAFASLLELDKTQIKIFLAQEEIIFGEVFYVYTTFSESQADINPVSDEGFQMIFDDMFSLLGDGDLAMMRMDAIKYLWKEIGKKNFDMDEGNKLIEIIRTALKLGAPRVCPLDEVNSPDPVVYSMGKGGGFYYLFGPVNSTVAAFNQESLEPLVHLNKMMEEQRADNLVLFVMLSTHDGRSVQGLGVDRTDGHISIKDFYALKEVILERGGLPKFRTVPKGTLPADTFTKVSNEMKWDQAIQEKILSHFTKEGGILKLQGIGSRGNLLTALSEATGESRESLESQPAVDYWLDWTIEGKTPYELCSTSRSAFTLTGITSVEQEARRLALAQLYVLTMGQVVPAIYMNDLLGLENDKAAYELSGRPRDLNRHKSHVNELDFDADPFQVVYIPLLNQMIECRSVDRAFYPGSPEFDFLTPGDKIFLNHAYHGGVHSFVLGNISVDRGEILLPIDELAGVTPGEITDLKDMLTGRVFPVIQGELHLVMDGFEGLWLKDVREDV